MHYSTPLFNNVPTHTTVDFACGLRAGSTVTCVRRQDQLPLFSYNIYYSTTNTAMGCTDTSVKGTKLISGCKVIGGISRHGGNTGR